MMVMVYRVAADAESSNRFFATQQFIERNKVKADQGNGFDLPPSRLDPQGRYFPHKDSFAPNWAK